MVELVKLEKGIFKFDPILFTIKEYKALIKRDRSKSGDRALKEFSYIAYFMDHRSPYTKYGDGDRMVKIISDLELDEDWRPDSLVTAAMERYRKDFQTAATISLRSLHDILNMTNTSIKYVAGMLEETFKHLAELQKGLKDPSEIDEEDIDEFALTVKRIATLDRLSGELIDKTTKIIALSGKLIPAIDNIGKLREAIKKEQTESNDIRGGGDVGEFED